MKQNYYTKRNILSKTLIYTNSFKLCENVYFYGSILVFNIRKIFNMDVYRTMADALYIIFVNGGRPLTKPLQQKVC